MSGFLRFTGSASVVVSFYHIFLEVRACHAQVGVR